MGACKVLGKSLKIKLSAVENEYSQIPTGTFERTELLMEYKIPV
jgi:hypothetical protein